MALKDCDPMPLAGQQQSQRKPGGAAADNRSVMDHLPGSYRHHPLTLMF